MSLRIARWSGQEDIDLIYALVSTPLRGNPQMEVLCQYECSDIVEIKFFNLRV